MMDNENKILEMIMSIAQDDIKDSEMMIRYAEKAYMMGDVAYAKFFLDRANQRINANFDADHAKMDEIIKSMKGKEDVVDEPNSVQGTCWDIMHANYMDWVNSVRMRMNELNLKIK